MWVGWYDSASNSERVGGEDRTVSTPTNTLAVRFATRFAHDAVGMRSNRHTRRSDDDGAHACYCAPNSHMCHALNGKHEEHDIETESHFSIVDAKNESSKASRTLPFQAENRAAIQPHRHFKRKNIRVSESISTTPRRPRRSTI